MLKDIVAARPAGGHKLWIAFEDGREGTVDVAELVEFRGVFAELQDPAKFAEVTVDSEIGTVRWPGGADLDPDVLYSRITGLPINIERAPATV